MDAPRALGQVPLVDTHSVAAGGGSLDGRREDGQRCGDARHRAAGAAPLVDSPHMPAFCQVSRRRDPTLSSVGVRPGAQMAELAAAAILEGGRALRPLCTLSIAT